MSQTQFTNRGSDLVFKEDFESLLIIYLNSNIHTALPFNLISGQLSRIHDPGSDSNLTLAKVHGIFNYHHDYQEATECVVCRYK